MMTNRRLLPVLQPSVDMVMNYEEPTVDEAWTRLQAAEDNLANAESAASRARHLHFNAKLDLKDARLGIGPLTVGAAYRQRAETSIHVAEAERREQAAEYEHWFARDEARVAFMLGSDLEREFWIERERKIASGELCPGYVGVIEIVLVEDEKAQRAPDAVRTDVGRM